MKILFIVSGYPPYDIGGGGIAQKEVTAELVRQGHQVDVVAGYYLTQSWFEKPSTYFEDGVQITKLPLVPNPSGSEYLNLRTVMPPNFFSIRALFTIVAGTVADVVHLHGFGYTVVTLGAIFCSLFDKPYIYTHYGYPVSPMNKGGTSKFVYKLYAKTFGKMMLRNAKAITGISQWAIEELSFASSAPQQAILMGINLEKYKRKIKPIENVRQRYDIPDNANILLSIGRIDYRKGFQFAVEAMPHVLKKGHKVVLVILGEDGGFRTELDVLINHFKLKEHVFLLGYVSEEDKSALLSECVIVVIPSTIEPFGLVGLEAMAVGKPVVSSNTGGLGEYLKQGHSALLVNPGDPQSLADAIITLLEDPTLRQRMHNYSLEKVSHFAWSEVVKKYVQVYQQALQKKKIGR